MKFTFDYSTTKDVLYCLNEALTLELEAMDRFYQTADRFVRHSPKVKEKTALKRWGNHLGCITKDIDSYMSLLVE